MIEFCSGFKGVNNPHFYRQSVRIRKTMFRETFRLPILSNRPVFVKNLECR